MRICCRAVVKVCAQGQLAGRRSLCWRLWLTSRAGTVMSLRRTVVSSVEVCLSLPRRCGVESNLSFGFFGVVERGLAVVVEAGLAVVVEPGLAVVVEPGLAVVVEPGLAVVVEAGLAGLL